MQKKFEIEKSILWIRNDQRISDNRALAECTQQSKFVVPIYVIDERLFRKNSFGLNVASSKRLQFLALSLRDLIAQYKLVNGNLLVKFGNPAVEITKVAQELGISHVFGSLEYTTHETQDESQLQANGLTLLLSENSTLVEITDLNFDLSRLPETFTIFRKKVEAHWHIKACAVRPIKISLVPDLSYNQSHQLIAEKLENNENINFFEGGETPATMRLRDFIWDKQSIANYKNTRNQLLGNDFSSKLSAWLSLGNLSPKMIYWEIQAFESEIQKNESTYWLVFELLWRDFFKFTALKNDSLLFQEKGIRGVKKERVNSQLLFENWTEGKTGNPFIDANMKELVQNGYMSNRGRQNVASYLIHDLKLNWKLGAEFFEHHLLDFDPALNYCNWQYIAGVGNDPKPVRYFDTLWQAEYYDPNGQFIAEWLPELSKIPKDLRSRPWLFDPKTYPKPIFLTPKD